MDEPAIEKKSPEPNPGLDLASAGSAYSWGALQQRGEGFDFVTDLSRSGRIAAVLVGTGWNGEAPEAL